MIPEETQPGNPNFQGTRRLNALEYYRDAIDELVLPCWVRPDKRSDTYEAGEEPVSARTEK